MEQLDRYEQLTVVCALLHYALSVYEPGECIECLDKISPHPSGSWRDSITESREQYKGMFMRAEAAVDTAVDAA